MDVITPSQLFGSDTRVPSSLIELQESNILSSASHFVEESSRQIQGKMLSIIFPKYNNYLKNPSLFDKTSKFFIPIDMLNLSYKKGIDNPTSDLRRSVVAYCIYRTAGVILPQGFDSNLKQRYGVELNIPSTVMSAVILTSEGEVLASSTETPIKYRIRVDYVNQRANPQCVHWKSGSNGKGLWTRENCWTEFSDPWVYNQEDYHVNCTCSSLGPTTVIMNKEEPYAVIESTIAEDIITYIGLVASIAFLAVAFICLSIIRGLQTNSNSIHRNLIICLLLAQAVYLLALKLRSLVHHHEVCSIYFKVKMSINYISFSSSYAS
jgi:cadherin EGF LAG seven-pass G-type receptor 1